MTITVHPALVAHATEVRKATGGRILTVNGIVDGPGFVSRPIPEAATQPKIVPRSAIVHTNAGASSASSLWSWITRKDNNGEPHFQVGYSRTEQYMPVDRRADCNYSANSFKIGATTFGAVSFECQDDGAATIDHTPLTLSQVDHIAAVLTLLAIVYGVQCTQPSVWNASGVGHHTLFPFQGIGHPAWTNVRGKTCPGKARIAQMDGIRQLMAHRLAEYSAATGWKCAGV